MLGYAIATRIGIQINPIKQERKMNWKYWKSESNILFSQSEVARGEIDGINTRPLHKTQYS